jgi:hypothetical protein
MTYKYKLQLPRTVDRELRLALEQEFKSIESAIKSINPTGVSFNESTAITKAVSTAGTVTVGIGVTLSDINYSVVPIMYCSDGTITVERFVPSSRTKNSFQVVCATTGTLHCLLSRSAQTAQVNKT